MFTSYAQNFEDVRLWRALQAVDNGRYIDIGAQDPIVDSVSRAFYERGWRGLHVEPSVLYAAKLRADRPDETVIQSAVGARSGLLAFYEFPDTGLSTADATLAQRHVDAGRAVTKISVPCTTLESLFQSFDVPEIHWLKIDVEGFEHDVLRGWGSSKVRPWVVVVESTLPMTQIESHAVWEQLLLRRGYRFACFDGLNRFYVARSHPELMDAFATAPNVFDNFSLSGTSTASFTAVSVARIQQLEDDKKELEAARQTDAMQFTREREVAESREQKASRDLDDARGQAQQLAQTLAAREDAAREMLRIVRQEGAAREDDLLQRLRESQQEHMAALHTGTARELRLTGQLQMARDEAVRLWDAEKRRESAFARHALRAQSAAAQLLAERDQQLAERNRRLAERDQLLSERDRMLGERHQMLTERDQMLAGRDQMLTDRDQILAGCDQMLTERDRLLAERDRRLALLRAVIARQDAFAQGVIASRSWRITMPARKLGQLMRRILNRPPVESLESIWAVNKATIEASALTEPMPTAPQRAPVPRLPMPAPLRPTPDAPPPIPATLRPASVTPLSTLVAPLPMPAGTAAIAREIALRANIIGQALVAGGADEGGFLPDIAKDP
jgi:FkbM family methyltransferase